jgi:hypothetical protein
MVMVVEADADDLGRLGAAEALLPESVEAFEGH